MKAPARGRGTAKVSKRKALAGAADDSATHDRNQLVDAHNAKVVSKVRVANIPRDRAALEFLQAFEPSIRKLAADEQARGAFTRWLSSAIEDLDEARREVAK